MNSRKGNLSAEANFARFYLTEMLPSDVEKVVYLDADTVVRKDVTHLYDTSLTQAATSQKAWPSPPFREDTSPCAGRGSPVAARRSKVFT